MAIPALFFAVGIASGRHGPVLAPPVVYTILFLAFSTGCYLLKIRRKSFLQPLSIALVFFVVGNANTAAPPQLDRHLADIAGAGRDVVFSGILRTAPAFNGSKGKFVIDADRFRTGSGATLPISARILLKTPFPLPAALAPGNRILVRAALSIPPPPGTPGSFNYRQYLIDRHIPLTGFIRSPAHLTAPPPLAQPDKQRCPDSYLPEYLRHRTNLFIDSSTLSGENKALYKAIITGQRDSVPVEIVRNFTHSGGIHLLAISGMHLGLLALLSGLALNYLLKKSSWLLLRWPVGKITAAFTLLILGGYALISGLQPPVVRAFIMAAMLIFAILIDRHNSLLNTLALAALIILSHEPVALFSASFQLSFIAVTAIILCHNQFPELFRPAGQQPTRPYRFVFWLRTGVIVSLIALSATAPLTIYHFRQVSLLGPITTILVAPLLGFWALPLGLLATVLSPWLPQTASSLLSLGSLGLTGADLITATVAKMPLAFQTLPPPSPITISIYYLLGLYLLFGQASQWFKVGVTAVMLLMISSPAGSFFTTESPFTRITFLDVGQGNATLLELPGGINILVDGGGSSSPGFDPGEQTIGPFLWHQSINRLDALVISHAHQDHYNGLAFIVRNFRPATIWLNGTGEKSRDYQHLLAAAAGTGAEIRVPEKGTVLATGGGAQLTSISNLHLRKADGLEANSRSLVIKLEVAGQRIILPGDIMAEDGQELKEQGINLGSDVLLAPHHGSRYSAGYLLVQEGAPEWLVVSASPFAAENFPDHQFVGWCQKQGTTVLNTATVGAISFTISEKGKINCQTISEKSARPLKPRDETAKAGAHTSVKSAGGLFRKEMNLLLSILFV